MLVGIDDDIAGKVRGTKPSDSQQGHLREPGELCGAGPGTVEGAGNGQIDAMRGEQIEGRLYDSLAERFQVGPVRGLPTTSLILAQRLDHSTLSLPKHPGREFYNRRVGSRPLTPFDGGGPHGQSWRLPLLVGV